MFLRFKYQVIQIGFYKRALKNAWISAKWWRLTVTIHYIEWIIHSTPFLTHVVTIMNITWIILGHFSEPLHYWIGNTLVGSNTVCNPHFVICFLRSNQIFSLQVQTLNFFFVCSEVTCDIRLCPLTLIVPSWQCYIFLTPSSIQFKSLNSILKWVKKLALTLHESSMSTIGTPHTITPWLTPL